MLIRLLMLFILVPLAEVVILIKVGAHIGVWPTILMVVGIGVFGAWLARREGWRALGRIQADLAAGRLPGDSAIDALLVLVGGWHGLPGRWHCPCVPLLFSQCFSHVAFRVCGMPMRPKRSWRSTRLIQRRRTQLPPAGAYPHS